MPQKRCCSVLHAAITSLNFFHEIWTITLADIKADRSCQTSEQRPSICFGRPVLSEDLTGRRKKTTRSRCVCDVSLLFFFTHRRKKGESIQVWVVTLMTRSPLTFKLHLTVNFRGTDVSARAQADAGSGARRLSNHLENTGNTRCFHFLLTF